MQNENSSANNSITDNQENFNPDNSITFFQETNNSDEKLIAGFTYLEVMEKLTALYEEFDENEANMSKQERDKHMAKIHVLENSFEVAEHPEKFA